jgi:hypothetical protein
MAYSTTFGTVKKPPAFLSVGSIDRAAWRVGQNLLGDAAVGHLVLAHRQRDVGH